MHAMKLFPACFLAAVSFSSCRHGEGASPSSAPPAPRSVPAKDVASTHRAPDEALPELPRGDLATAKLDVDAVRTLVERARLTDSDALVVLHDGKVVVEEYFGRPRRPIEAMSATKSIVALAIARLVHEGVIPSFDTPVHTYYPQWRQGRKRQITIRHLMNHTSGLQNVRHTGEEIYPSPDFVELALAAELVADPGEAFSYNNKAVNLLAGIVERASGVRMDRYIADRLFAPLDIEDFGWTLDDAGNPHGMSGLQIHAVDLAKLGQLVLDRGKYGGETIIGAEVLDALVQGDPELDSGACGLLWWLVPQNQEFAITPRLFEQWREGGAQPEFLKRVKPLVGGRWTKAELRTQLRSIFETKEEAQMWGRNTWQRGLPDVEVVSTGPIIAYRAEGFLGQHLVVVPSARLVAVRQNRAADDPSGDEAMPDFIDLVLALAAGGETG